MKSGKRDLNPPKIEEALKKKRTSGSFSFIDRNGANERERMRPTGEIRINIKTGTERDYASEDGIRRMSGVPEKTC